EAERAVGPAATERPLEAAGRSDVGPDPGAQPVTGDALLHLGDAPPPVGDDACEEVVRAGAHRPAPPPSGVTVCTGIAIGVTGASSPPRTISQPDIQSWSV